MKQLNKNIILSNIPKNRVNVDIYDEIESTNELSKDIAFKNEFNLILAEKQTSGKGRHGKRWYSPKNGNIYMSLSTKKDLDYAPLSLLTGIICANVLSEHTKKDVIGLKWPNDIVLDNKKIGGILIEKAVVNNEITSVIGIGLNFCIESKEKWWGDLSSFDIGDLRNEIISNITTHIIKAYDQTNDNWINEWRKYCIHIDKEVKIIQGDNSSQDAIFKDIDNNGCALLQTDMGLKKFNSGEVSIKGVY